MDSLVFDKSFLFRHDRNDSGTILDSTVKRIDFRSSRFEIFSFPSSLSWLISLSLLARNRPFKSLLSPFQKYDSSPAGNETPEYALKFLPFSLLSLSLSILLLLLLFLPSSFLSGANFDETTEICEKLLLIGILIIQLYARFLSYYKFLSAMPAARRYFPVICLDKQGASGLLRCLLFPWIIVISYVKEGT